ncbi:LOW QUALITY PROTEIN: hypothetical protein V1477_006284 [Vespula maculifrons]|uniref:Ribosomal protein L2 n=1 Tax=Vespula maculifrons TaxID=7453 RepID=A0ABD2CKU2_VESMC
MGRALRGLSSDSGPFAVCAIVSEKKIVKEKCFFPMFSLNRYNSAPIGPIWTKKYERRGRDEPFPTTQVRKELLNENVFFLFSFQTVITRPLLVRSGRKKYGRRGRCEPFPVTPKRIVKGKCFFPIFLSNRYNSAPIGPIWTKKICASRALRALSSDPGPVLLGAIVSEGKIVKEKFFIPLCFLNRYNSAPIGPIWTKKIRAARPALSNDPGAVLLRFRVSEKKIVKEKCFFPLFPLNRYNSAPIGAIWTKKIWA